MLKLPLAVLPVRIVIVMSCLSTNDIEYICTKSELDIFTPKIIALLPSLPCFWFAFTIVHRSRKATTKGLRTIKASVNSDLTPVMKN